MADEHPKTTRLLGLTLIVVGFLYAMYKGANLIFQSRESDISDMQLIPSFERLFNWSPFIGIVIMLLGIVLLRLGLRKKKVIGTL